MLESNHRQATTKATGVFKMKKSEVKYRNLLTPVEKDRKSEKGGVAEFKVTEGCKYYEEAKQ